MLDTEELMVLFKVSSLNPIWPFLTFNVTFNIALESGNKWML